MALQFSKDGKYFAYISTDGKLKIWDTVSNTFEQEFTPDYHLTSPCTCLHFIPSDIVSNTVSIAFICEVMRFIYLKSHQKIKN